MTRTSAKRNGTMSLKSTRRGGLAPLRMRSRGGLRRFRRLGRTARDHAVFLSSAQTCLERLARKVTKRMSCLYGVGENQCGLSIFIALDSLAYNQ